MNRKNILIDIYDNEREVSRNAIPDKSLFQTIICELYTDFQFKQTRNMVLKNNIFQSLFDSQHNLGRDTIIQSTYKKQFEVIR
jgi:hypothetical protein